MDRRSLKSFAAALLVTAVLLPSRLTHATLGEPADSVAKDRQALSAARRAATSRNGYTVHEMVSAGSTVREYVAPSGIVFAIAWNGISQPDLTPLLGSYKEEYLKALGRSHRRQGRRFSRVEGSRVVVEKWGHMRNYQGRAYDPALIPSGVTIDEIR